jgi:hypothetical protein
MKFYSHSEYVNTKYTYILAVENGKLVYTYSIFGDSIRVCILNKIYNFSQNIKDYNIKLPKWMKQPDSVSCFIEEVGDEYVSDIKKGIHKPFIPKIEPKLPKYHIIEKLYKYGDLNDTIIHPFKTLEELDNEFKRIQTCFAKRGDKWFAEFTHSKNKKTISGNLDL